MKVRVKETGEIINIADYARVTLDKCDSYGNPIELSFDDVEILQEMSVSYYSVLRFSLNFSSLTVVLEIVFVLLGLQYKHIWVKGEYTLPHFGQIQPCCPNTPLYGLTALDSCFII